ncbi:hypothetical protein BJ508DRAFT_214298 [Ascobolus immersus RN42]|uniref:C2H2-type domain-containing protein n=1 Tax=Ascobolus immersus RN42 TaxID=1160509 RepID=A0A3N4HT45_ASCIM|nr:hypothetical protein BJ508DRAFT_214298 [Ascobolus immersus RN42]
MHPPSKTDKPRPHVCGTCARPFARLEHLKRHERSHTKEKPFECPECTRCFARRDLLLRHQQKLHYNTTPSSRPRNGSRRDSTTAVPTTGTTGGRVRKNSVSVNSTSQTTSSGVTGGRPRANTIAHVDSSTLNMLAQQSSHHTDQHQQKQQRRTQLQNQQFSSQVSALISTPPMVPTSALDLDLYFPSTVNPAALQLYGSPLQQPLGSPTSPFTTTFPGLDSQYSLEDEDFEWLNPNPFGDGTGSPSGLSQTSASEISQVVLENQNWNRSNSHSMPSNNYNHLAADYNYPNFGTTPTGSNLPIVSPRSLMEQANTEQMYPGPAINGLPISPSMAHVAYNTQYPVYGPDPPAPVVRETTASVMQACVDSITDATRSALLATLALPVGFSRENQQQGNRGRRYSASAATTLTVNYFSNTRPAPSVALPSTHDLKRYVSSYFEHFHPHLPFLHIPTLNLSSSPFVTTYRDGRGGSGGGGCLVLAMAAIGALYAGNTTTAQEIFESTWKTISVALDDRRKADLTAAINGLQSRSDRDKAPLWLVQAMLLYVMYGLHCDNRLAWEMAKSQSQALTKLARSAGLYNKCPDDDEKDVDVQMADLGLAGFGDEDWPTLTTEIDEEEKWRKWVMKEERKRTLFGVHMVSGLLVACHNTEPQMANAEINLDLPCHEDLWSAPSSAIWKAHGGATFAEQSSVEFSAAFSNLFGQMQQPYQAPADGYQDGETNLPNPPQTIVTSSFGCLSLLSALHLHIWDWRQRQQQNSGHWATTEAEAMHAHIEPALKAWQSVWLAIPQNRAERNGLFAWPALSADCIPLLDLAYLRLFVDFGSAKDCFWHNDFDGMAEELMKGWQCDIQRSTQNASPSSASSVSFASDALVSPHSPASSPTSTSSSPTLTGLKYPTPIISNFGGFMSTTPTRREKHLRKAACFAADSLSMSNPMFNTNSDADWNLPVQFALCAFDCALVLGEWIATVQERVGPTMGMLGSESCNFESLEGLMMLDEEDRALLSKVTKLLEEAQTKLAMSWNTKFAMRMAGGKVSSGLGVEGGLASMILMLGAYMLDKMTIWPVARTMANALRTQAQHVEERINNGLPVRR